MKRITLKEVKDILNKVDDEKLEMMFLTHRGYTEDPERKFTVMFNADEGSEECEELSKLFKDGNSMDEFYNKFITVLNKDVETMIDEKKFDKLLDGGMFDDPSVVAEDWEKKND